MASETVEPSINTALSSSCEEISDGTVLELGDLAYNKSVQTGLLQNVKLAKQANNPIEG